MSACPTQWAHSQTAVASVEFIVDMQSGDEVTLLNSANWDLHFIFIREVIDRQSHLDRCVPGDLKNSMTHGRYLVMLRAFFAVLRHVDDPTHWVLRPDKRPLLAGVISVNCQRARRIDMSLSAQAEVQRRFSSSCRQIASSVLTLWDNPSPA